MKKLAFVLVFLIALTAVILAGCGKTTTSEDVTAETYEPIEVVPAEKTETEKAIELLKSEYRSGLWDGSRRIMDDGNEWYVDETGILSFDDEFGGSEGHGYAIADLKYNEVLRSVRLDGNELAVLPESGDTIFVYSGDNRYNIIPLETDGYELDSRARLYADGNCVTVREGEYAAVINLQTGKQTATFENASDCVVNGMAVKIACFDGDNYIINSETGKTEKLPSHWRQFPVDEDLDMTGVPMDVQNRILPRGRVFYAGTGMDETYYYAYANQEGAETYTLVRRDGSTVQVVAENVIQAESSIGNCYYITTDGKVYRHSGDMGSVQVFTDVDVVGLAETYSEDDAVCAVTNEKYANVDPQHGWEYLYNPNR